MIRLRLTRISSPFQTRLSSTFIGDSTRDLNLNQLKSNNSNDIKQPVINNQKRLIGYLYFDSLFPIVLGVWDLRRYLVRLDDKSLMDKAKTLIPMNSLYSIQLEEVNPVQKDGGAFVKFSYSIPEQPFLEEETESSSSLISTATSEIAQQKVLNSIEKEARTNLMSNGGIKPWFNFSRESNAYLVKGTPWIEDLYRFPNNVIRVEFDGPELSQEDLYTIFRPYGRIKNIIPPPSTKDSPRLATIIFREIRSATAARNSLHAARTASILTSSASTSSTTTIPLPSPPSTILRISYAERTQAHHIRDFARDHPRITLPVLVALLGLISFTIFDPIRAGFIKFKMTRTSLAKDKENFLDWLNKKGQGIFSNGKLGEEGSGSEGINASGIEHERNLARDKVIGWLKDAPDTFIVITGPRGSGKTGLIQEVVKDRHDVLMIDCDAICKNARDDTKLVSELAAAIGYFPQFTLAASLNNLIDLASVATIGTKAGFSSSLDVQLKSILEVAASALKDIMLRNTSKSDKESKRLDKIRKRKEAEGKVVEKSRDKIRNLEVLKDGKIEAEAEEINGAIVVADKAPVSSTTTTTTTNLSTSHDQHDHDHEPHARSVGADLPVVIMKGFAAKGDGKHTEIMFTVLADWATELVENKIAHVIFTSDTVTLGKHLSRALPNKPFSSISLNDAPPDAAAAFVESKLKEFELSISTSAKESVALLGGRQEDLQLLVQKIIGGIEADVAVEEIINRTAVELRKNIFGDSREEAKSLSWTRAMAWKLVKSLAEEEEIKYAETLVEPPFKGDENSLRALEQAELITIHHRHGRPSLIRPGKPVFRSSFSRLIEDKVFAASIEYEISEKSIKSGEKEFTEASNQLIELSKLFGGTAGNNKWVFGGGSVPKEISVRVDMLLKEMKDAEEKIEKHEKKKLIAEKILKEEI